MLYELNIKSKKLGKLGVHKQKNDEVEESNNLGQSSWWWNSF